jgi:hypothetical protein
MAISDRTKRLLWSRSGGYCQNPECHRDFFVFFQDGNISSLEELAHVIGQSNQGPRGKSDLSVTERDEYNNIILLCPNCHSLIDKNPLQFSVKTLQNWKQRHEEAIKLVFVVPVYGERQDLAQSVHKLLRINKVIFQQYGPHSLYAIDPFSDAVKDWKRHVLADVIPNNRKIANLLSVNEYLLTEDEKHILDMFTLHQQAFEYNHVSGDKTAYAPLFPKEMNNILRGE